MLKDVESYPYDARLSDSSSWPNDLAVRQQVAHVNAAFSCVALHASHLWLDMRRLRRFEASTFAEPHQQFCQLKKRSGRGESSTKELNERDASKMTLKASPTLITANH
jgi:hypothetical protein